MVLSSRSEGRGLSVGALNGIVKKIFGIFLLLIPVTAFGRVHVQTQVTPYAPGANSMAIVLPSNPTEGDTVCVAVTLTESNTGELIDNMTVTDSNGNSYTPTTHSPTRDTEVPQVTGDVWMFYLPRAPGNASATINVTWTNSASSGAIIADEFSGGSTYDSDAGEADYYSTSGNVAVPSITPAASGELLYALGQPQYHMNAPSPGGTLSGWTGGDWSNSAEGDIWLTTEYILSGSSGSTNVAYTLSGAGDYFTGLVMALASTGNCPSTAGGSATTCYFIAANGSDSNSGTSESSPWLHAPGMPNCTGNCASLLGSQTSGTSAAGMGFIFRGGDTWHFGNSSLSPYTGGTWAWAWPGNSNCVYEGTMTGCVYIGVDKNWYSGSSWTRPILNADNPTSTAAVASCAYQIPSYASQGSNVMFSTSSYEGWYVVVDNFEVTGLCQNSSPATQNNGAYFVDNGNGGSPPYPQFFTNNYCHGWTVISSMYNASPSAGYGFGLNCFYGSTNGNDIYVGNVVDGSDSLPVAIAFVYPNISHMKDNIFRYVAQGVGGDCHDIHDNIFEHYFDQAWANAHQNIIECNSDAAGSTPNVFYNNIVRHDDPSFANADQVHVWLCPNNTAPEYYFGNLEYDVGTSNSWDMNCNQSSSSQQFMFNNTLVNLGDVAPCSGLPSLTSYNNNFIATGFNGSGCTGYSSSTNVVLTLSQSDSQGYTGTAGTFASDTCENDTTPCSPTASSNSTVGAGSNLQSYCTKLASYTSEYAIGTEAANACQYGTTDGCAYNTSNHTMSCPAQTAIARPSSGAWDSGAYEYATGTALPNPPTGLSATVN